MLVRNSFRGGQNLSFLPSVIPFFSSFLPSSFLFPSIIFSVCLSFFPFLFLLSCFLNYFFFLSGRKSVWNGDTQTIPYLRNTWAESLKPCKGMTCRSLEPNAQTFLLIFKFQIFSCPPLSPSVLLPYIILYSEPCVKFNHFLSKNLKKYYTIYFK